MKSWFQIQKEMENESGRHQSYFANCARYCYKFGGGSVPDPGPAPSPVPRKVEVDVAAAEKEERALAARRRSRTRSILTRGIDFGPANTSKSELLGL